jgi:thiamine transport system permease protein
MTLLDVLNSFYFWSALSTTFTIGFFSGTLSIILTYGNLVFLNKSKNSSEFWFYILIIFSPGILAVGYYIFFNEIIDYSIPNILIIIIINSIITLPFTYNYLSPSFFRVSKEHHDISESINIYGTRRFFFIDWPRLREPLITAFCVSSILSASDLVIISFFGTNDLSTLTQTIYRLMGSYRMDEAYAVSLLLLIYCFIYFMISYKLILRKWNT